MSIFLECALTTGIYRIYSMSTVRKLITHSKMWQILFFFICSFHSRLYNRFKNRIHFRRVTPESFGFCAKRTYSQACVVSQHIHIALFYSMHWIIFFSVFLIDSSRLVIHWAWNRKKWSRQSALSNLYYIEMMAKHVLYTSQSIYLLILTKIMKFLTSIHRNCNVKLNHLKHHIEKLLQHHNTFYHISVVHYKNGHHKLLRRN